MNAAETQGTAEETYTTEETFLTAKEIWDPLRAALEFYLDKDTSFFDFLPLLSLVGDSVLCCWTFKFSVSSAFLF